MDSDSSSSDSEELFPIVSNQYRGVESDIFRYDDPLLVTGVLRAVVEEDLAKVQDMVTAGKAINLNDNNGNTPLHIAVIKNNLEILEYLLSQEDIRVNTRNFRGETPLFQAVRAGKVESTTRLIQAGANVNLPDYEDITPLHKAVTFPNIAHVLIQHDADIDVLDFSGDAPLHDAITNNCLETVCMLLYYNADANILGGNNLTPFMKALISENIEMQEVLFEYVADFNATTGDKMPLLSLALTHNTLFMEEIIERGANVNYIDFINEDFACAFTLCLRVPNPVNFKLIWEKLIYNPQKNTINLCLLFEFLQATRVEEYLQAIVESDNMKVAVDSLMWNKNFYVFINRFAENNLNLDLLTKLMCRLILDGYCPSTYDIYAIFFHYGYCELFRILLYIENNEEIGGWLPHMILPRLIFNVHCKLKYVMDGVVDIYRNELETLLEYFVYPPLINLCLQLYREDEDVMVILHRLPKVPCLLELARNRAREHIAYKFRAANTCKFYTIINYLNISRVYKQILSFEKKLYKIHE
ncbi:hypothetical protein NQ318_011932 [Aromia moschata]|uniref:Ankyrin repeat-containing protein n=1 Tax=Aromia moschata TaxID=1265417 RepID=A0AAV8XH73_9CUCU|nr:hypothetical protein NQ318_011932 [Aromia moschata]